jgi:hypothetical protein
MIKILDTPDHIRKLQNEIFLKNSLSRRFELGFQMIEGVKKIVENSIRLKNPQISEIDLKVEVFERFYKNDFSEEKKKDIIRAMREYYE